MPGLFAGIPLHPDFAPLDVFAHTDAAMGVDGDARLLFHTGALIADLALDQHLDRTIEPGNQGMGSFRIDHAPGALVLLAVALGDHGIRVNGIAPGLIRTPLTASWMEGRPDAGQLLDHYKKKVLLRRIGMPEDCAGAVVFLCSPAAGYITGEIITIDGGLTVVQIGKQ